MAQVGSVSVKFRIETTEKWFASLPHQVEKRKKEAAERKTRKKRFKPRR